MYSATNMFIIIILLYIDISLSKYVYTCNKQFDGKREALWLDVLMQAHKPFLNIIIQELKQTSALLSVTIFPIL